MSTPTTQEFRNESYTVNVSHDSGCKVIFNISFPPKTSEAIYRKAIKAVSKEVSLPGFRKGKAPDEFIVTKFGDSVQREWKEQALETAFHEAMKLAQVYPFRKDSIRNAKVNALSKSEDSSLTIEFESMPTVPEISIEGISIADVEPEPVKEEKVTQIIEDIRYQLATWDVATDRTVQEGDFVDLDILSIDNPEELDLKDTRVEVAQGKIGQWLYDLLIGKNPGETFDGQSAQEPGKETPEFKPTNLRITVNSINVSTLPEIDDELAKKAGAESLIAMKERIARDVEKAHFKQALDKRRQHLIDAVINKYPFDVPSSLITKTAQQMIRHRVEKLQEIGDESSLTPEALEEMEKNTYAEVKKYYQWQFITQEVAEKEKIQVPQQEIIGEVMQRQYLDPRRQAGDQKTMEEMFSEVAGQLIAMKTADFFLEKLEA